jgi:hypothetical protein
MAAVWERWPIARPLRGTTDVMVAGEAVGDGSYEDGAYRATGGWMPLARRTAGKQNNSEETGKISGSHGASPSGSLWSASGAGYHPASGAHLHFSTALALTLLCDFMSKAAP